MKFHFFQIWNMKPVLDRSEDQSHVSTWHNLHRLKGSVPEGARQLKCIVPHWSTTSCRDQPTCVLLHP